MVRIGLPAAVQNLIYTSISMVLTRFVAGFGDAAVAVQSRKPDRIHFLDDGGWIRGGH